MPEVEQPIQERIEPVPMNTEADNRQQDDYAERIREETAAVRLFRTRLRQRVALNSQQMQQAAAEFHADASFLHGSKRLLNTNAKPLRDVSAAMIQAYWLWKTWTVPYPERQIRLLRRDRIDMFRAEMAKIQDSLKAASEAAQEQYETLKDEARQRLGDLFNADDYPTSLIGQWTVSYDFPSVEPPDYLRQLNPRLYEEQQAIVRRRFEEAIQLTEQAFTEELAQHVKGMVEKLQPTPEGERQKVIQTRSIDNMLDFFRRFRELNVGSNDELERLARDAEAAVQGVDVKALRGDTDTRTRVREALSGLSGRIDALMVDAPVREIQFDD
jgi:hypothetical protein